MIKERVMIAYQMAKTAHEGQFRKYSHLAAFTHPKCVARRIEELCDDEDMIITSLLHDTLEDTALVYRDIEDKFGFDVAQLVLELTSNETECKIMGKTNYLISKMERMSDKAFTIKLADREHNIKFMARDTDLNSKQSMSFLRKYYKETKTIIDEFMFFDYSKVQRILADNINLILKELDYRFELEECELKIDEIYKIDINDNVRELFTTNFPIIGKVWQQDEEHIYVKTFGADVKGIIHYGFHERIPRYMIKTCKEIE